MAVAIWNAEPSDAALLEARLARGWAPTATSMVDGPKVLGYAACVAPKR
jgi:hypothetical protein